MDRKIITYIILSYWILLSVFMAYNHYSIRYYTHPVDVMKYITPMLFPSVIFSYISVLFMGRQEKNKIVEFAGFLFIYLLMHSFGIANHINMLNQSSALHETIHAVVTSRSSAKGRFSVRAKDKNNEYRIPLLNENYRTISIGDQISFLAKKGTLNAIYDIQVVDIKRTIKQKS